MSQRTSISAVVTLLQRDYDTGLVQADAIQPRIDTATVMVDRVAACAVKKKRNLTTAELELIERWLAAHYYVTTDRTYASRSTQGASGAFHGQATTHLEATFYGQSAIDIDYSGCLVAISKRAFADMAWLGKVPSEQIDVDQRD